MKKENKVEVLLQEIKLNTINITLIGKTPLLMDRMTEETKAEILENQTVIAKGNKKKARNIKKEQHDAVHITNGGKIGFPVYGFKKGMMDCTARVGNKFFSKPLIQGAVKIMNVEDGLIPIEYKKQDILQHSIKTNTKFTPQFHDWSCDLEIQYDSNNISAQDIITLLNYAGFYIGIGAWRPKGRDGGSGEYGTYKVKAK